MININKYEKSKWVKTFIEKYKTGVSNLFVITGNIGDYATPGKMFKDYLTDNLVALGMDKVLTYDFADELLLKYTKNETIKDEYNEKYNVSSKSEWSILTSELQDSNGKTAFIIEYPEFIFPSGTNNYIDDNSKNKLVGLLKVINGNKFLASNNILIFITEATSNMNPLFLSSNARSSIINVDYPTEIQRYDFIEYLEESHKTYSDKKIVVSKNEDTTKLSSIKNRNIDNVAFSKLTAGLTLVSIEDIYLLAEAKGVLDKKIILERKKELMNKEFGEVIEIFNTDGYSLDNFAGQEHIKTYHREVIINPIANGDTSIVPMGVLYSGPPGTGKTYFGNCLAGDAGVNFISFKMSKILDKYVGEAEKKLEKAFRCFESFAPVIVFIDEIDQALGRGDGDSHSVTKNLFGMFLGFLSNPAHRGKIIWIGATNYPNKLDEALKRAGRFDKKIPFLPPKLEERIEVFKIHLNKCKLKYEISDEGLNKLGEMTEGYTQAEIENVVIKALELAKRKKLDKISADTLNYAIECMCSSQNDKIQEMTQIAIDECNDLEFLPEEYRASKRFKK